jgi:hypothetical protein
MVRVLVAGVISLFLVNGAIAAEGAPASALKQAGEKGIVQAQLLLGSQYLLGHGVTRDVDKARHWYKRAANQGDPKAQTVLGLIHLSGTGVSINEAMAATWFQMAALQGSGQAQLALGELFADGRGVDRDYTEAHMWASLAISNLPIGENLDEAIRLRDSLSEKMSKDEIAEARDRAAGLNLFARKARRVRR